MKKFSKILTVLTLIFVVLSLTACSNASLTTSNYLWFSNPSAFKSNFKETLVYDVSFVNTTNADSTPVKVDGYNLEVEEGYYTTTLEAKTDKNGNYYVYTTELKLKATYIKPNSSQAFTDTLKTVSRFTENLTPITTTKEYFSEYDNYKYRYEINYEEKKATATLVESDIEENNFKNNTFTFNNYTKGAFIDNDIILLAPRLYNVTNSFFQEFKTIDVLSNKNYDMQFYAYLLNQDVDVKVLPGYTLNGQEVGAEGLQCNHVQMVIKDNFAGAPLETYYAQDRETHRHRLIETFTHFGNIGYLKYKLVSATVEND